MNDSSIVVNRVPKKQFCPSFVRQTHEERNLWGSLEGVE